MKRNILLSKKLAVYDKNLQHYKTILWICQNWIHNISALSSVGGKYLVHGRLENLKDEIENISSMSGVLVT